MSFGFKNFEVIMGEVAMEFATVSFSKKFPCIGSGFK